MSRAAVSLGSERSLEDLRQLLAWYKSRDTFFGQNAVPMDFKKAIMLAAVCKHAEAKWFTNLLDRSSSWVEAKEVFLGCETDPRALCFAGVLQGNEDEIRRSADLGDAFAQAEMALRTSDEERFGWAKKSAVQGERDGFHALGWCYRIGEGCGKDKKRASEYFLIAAELWNVFAMLRLGELFGPEEPRRFFWLGRAAANGELRRFLNVMQEPIRNFNSGNGHGCVVFVIERVFRGQIDVETREIFGSSCNFALLLGPANQALRFFEFQLQSSRKAVDAWKIVAVRNAIVKDVRKMIGKIAWDSRSEAKYLMERQKF
jgi:hypothetical protein